MIPHPLTESTNVPNRGTQTNLLPVLKWIMMVVF